MCISSWSAVQWMEGVFCSYSSPLGATEPLGATVSVDAWLRSQLAVIPKVLLKRCWVGLITLQQKRIFCKRGCPWSVWFALTGLHMNPRIQGWQVLQKGDRCYSLHCELFSWRAWSINATNICIPLVRVQRAQYFIMKTPKCNAPSVSDV